MSPLTHLVGSWLVAVATTNNPRDRKLVTLAGVLPDADGLGAVADVENTAIPCVWSVSIPAGITRFRVRSRAGDPLVTFDDVALRVRLAFEKYKPAHTAIWWTGA